MQIRMGDPKTPACFNGGQYLGGLEGVTNHCCERNVECQAFFRTKGFDTSSMAVCTAGVCQLPCPEATCQCRTSADCTSPERPLCMMTGIGADDSRSYCGPCWSNSDCGEDGTLACHNERCVAPPEGGFPVEHDGGFSVEPDGGLAGEEPDFGFEGDPPLDSGAPDFVDGFDVDGEAP